MIDIYANVRGRDLGAIGRDIDKVVSEDRHLLPRGSFVTVRGQLETMRASYVDLFEGLAFSILLVYLLIVVNFQSWLGSVHHHHRAAGGAGGHRAVPVLYRARH